MLTFSFTFLDETQTSVRREKCRGAMKDNIKMWNLGEDCGDVGYSGD